MEKFFYETKKVCAIIIITVIIIIGIAPISEAANYTEFMRIGRTYEYRGSLLIVYRDKNAAKRSNIFKRKELLSKGDEITIEEIDGNIVKIGREKYIKLNFFNNATKFKDITDKIKEPQQPQQTEIKVTEIKLNAEEVTIYLNKGGEYKLEATINPINATNKRVIWTSSNTMVATVDQNGLVTATNMGETQITARTEDGAKTATCEIKVTRLEMNESSIELNVGDKKTLEVRSLLNNKKRTASWKSDNTGIATVDSSGKVTAKGKGSTIIRATTAEGVELVCNVTVNEISVTGVKLNKATLKVGVKKSATLSATISPTNATNKNVTWSSNNTDIATVNSNGKVTGVKTGQAKITVKTKDGGYTDTCTVTVIKAVTGVTIDKTKLTMYIGQTSTLTATVSPKDAENKSVTWSSNNTDVATVNSSGKIRAVAEGETTITVKTNDGGYLATCTVTVDPYKYEFGGIVYKIAVKSDKLDSVLNTIKTKGIYQNNGWKKGMSFSSNYTNGKCYRIALCHIDMLLNDDVEKNVVHSIQSSLKGSYSTYYQNKGGPDCKWTLNSKTIIQECIDEQKPVIIHTYSSDNATYNSRTGKWTKPEHWVAVVGYKGDGWTMDDLLFISCTEGVLCVNGEKDVHGHHSDERFKTLAE